jgi:hypothetical protein
MPTRNKPRKQARPPKQRTITAHTVVAQVFRLFDSEGKERASLIVDSGIAMFALCDKDQMPRLSLSVMPDGSAIVCATHRTDGGNLDDSFRLTIKSGEPEMIMRDAIFKNASIVSPLGFFIDEG